MAVEIGTATDFWDLYSKLRTFLTTNVDLVNAGEAWVQLAGPAAGPIADPGAGSGDAGNDPQAAAYSYVLEGPGTGGTDEIRVNVSVDWDSASNRYNLCMRGLTNWNGAEPIDDQLNMSDFVASPMWNSASIPYWFVASGRCFKFVAQVSTVYTAGYAGFILPYATPSEYPYPMAIGGADDNANTLYSDQSVAHSHFVNPSSSLKLCFPDNQWRNFTNFNVGSGNSYSFQNDRCVAPWGIAGGIGNDIRAAMFTLRENFGGSYPLMKATLQSEAGEPGRAVYGVLDGCYHVPGIGNSAGNIITAGGKNHLVVQNVFRTDNHFGYWALELE